MDSANNLNKLKILSWNIWFYGDLVKVNEFLEKSNADILGLQEVMMADKKIQLSKRLTGELGYKYIYSPAFQYPINGVNTDIGNAIFSRYPIVSNRIHNLSDKDNRIAVQADVKVGNKILHIFSTHLYHVHLDKEDRQRTELQKLQAENLIKVIPEEDSILMGDFNCLPQSEAIKVINNKLKNTDTDLLPTWSVYPEGCKVCSPNGIKYKFDNIFISNNLKSSNYKVEDSKASDHLPISVKIEI